MNLQLANGDELCCVIERVADLEWRRFQARVVVIALKTGEIYREDNSKFPPFTSIRFKSENPELITKLKSAIASYNGEVEWQIFSHERLTLSGVNWIIRPTFVGQIISETKGDDSHDWGKYVAEHYPDFAPIAYADLLRLAEHVRKALEG